MGLFGGLFDKKNCGVCGKELGLMGKRKLEDAVICKDCAGKLSPFFNERKESTLAQIQEQLAYREANKAAVAAFNVTRTLGGRTRVLLDEDAGKFLVTSSGRWRDENPDIIDFTQVTGCNSDIRESRTEVRREKPDGTSESYNPPRYDVDYDFYVTINVNSPWFDEITFQTNSYRIEQQGSAEFQEAQRQVGEIREALAMLRTQVREDIAAAKAPRTAQTCPHCGATTIPDANGRCEWCGGAMGA